MGVNTSKKEPLAKLKDVAREAGVSIATVSLALRNHDSISEETRKRVLESKQRLGYHRVRKRKLLLAETFEATTQKQNLLYCIIDFPLSRPVYSGSLEGVMNACQQHKIRLELISGTSDSFQIDPSLQSNIGGTILTGNVTREVVEYFSNSGLKVVVLGNYDIPNVHTVEVDISHAGRMVAKRIAEEGHKNIVYLLQWPDNYFEREYLMGFRDELALRGLALPSSRILPVSDTLHSFAKIAEHLTNMKPHVTAVVCAAFDIAEGCLGELRPHAKSDKDKIPTFYALGRSRKTSLNPHLVLLDTATEKCGYLAVAKLCQIIADEQTMVYATVVRSAEWAQ